MQIEAALTVTISKAEYDRLIERDGFLSALQNQGVDNWDGYEFAQEEYYGDENR